MEEKYIIAGILIFVLICWAVFVAVWRSNQRRLAEWRDNIKKGDQCYFVSSTGQKAFVTVTAVDRSKVRDIQIAIVHGGTASYVESVKASDLYPAPIKGDY